MLLRIIGIRAVGSSVVQLDVVEILICRRKNFALYPSPFIFV